ncbi:hypothetical protein Ddye_011670 [Dipteronia dyeriana]|uniref:RBR-type E3 ubiquitin transferase n=1 Tax=Dipteronia dyeriana TaxID=168575 RepID=A0AAD9X2X5_9ROSI|nr:hypothetical protein Ddye_011670 [Dipteronia dyeriana]
MEKETEIISQIFIDGFEQEEEDFQLLDSKYAEELQFQEALMASIITSQISTTSTQMTTTTNTIQASLQPEPLAVMINTPSCESSGSQTTFCEICVEIKQSDEMFTTESCNHCYCCECISKHVSTKVHDSAKVVITCPGVNCKSVLGIDACREVIPKEVVEVWEEALCEELIAESDRFYCPYKDCSALLLNDCEEEVVVVEAECPVCHRLFCAQCCVPWHSGAECEEFRRLNEDERGREDLMVLELAKDNKWSRCPRCKFYVERTQGCPHIICRCSYQFCYGCESEWTDTHGGCTRD